MFRRLSSWVLLGAVVGIGYFLFRLIQPFLLPLFLALVLALLAWPLFERLIVLCRGRRRIAAFLATATVVFLVIAPLAAGLTMTGRRLMDVADRILPAQENASSTALKARLAELERKVTPEEYAAFRERILKRQTPTAALDSSHNEAATADLEALERDFPVGAIRDEMNNVTIGDVLSPRDSPWFDRWKSKLGPYVPAGFLENLSGSISAGASDLLRGLYQKTTSFMASVVTVIVGFGVMTFALYYFFADGPRFAQAAKTLVPLDVRDEVSLFHRFDEICRGVVLGTFAAAVVQAVLLGIGLAVAGVPYVWLLSLATLVAAMVPVLGAGAVYVPAAGYLIFQQQYLAAGLLLAWGAGIVSTSDNLVRAFVLEGRTSLHPLIGLVSMLGGLQLIGLWGIFIGPIVAGFFYSLLKILHQKMEDDKQRVNGAENRPTPHFEKTDAGVIVPSH